MSPTRRISLHEYKERRVSDGREKSPLINNFRSPAKTMSLFSPNSSLSNRSSECEKIPALELLSTTNTSFDGRNNKNSHPLDNSLVKKSKDDHWSGGGQSSKKANSGAKSEEPEILTLSSSDEEDTSNESGSNDPNYSLINQKEPALSSFIENEEISGSGKKDPPARFGTLKPRIIRIGSYKYLPGPNEETLLLGSSFKMNVNSIDGRDKVAIIIPFVDTVKVLACFSRNEPLLFLYVKPKIAALIRKSLHMSNKNDIYFDPTSKEQSHRRITFVLHKIDSYTKESFAKVFGAKYGQTPRFEELNLKEAEKVLKLSSPSHAYSAINDSEPPVPTSRTILTYPPPPSKGRITITQDDYLCLAEECFINDVIIDFYLKWLLLSKLSEVHRQHTHVFSTFFYKRLTFKPKSNKKSRGFDDTAHASNAAERRHARVKSWSKGVDIFEKDFIMVPINEKSHWFLAVICFPGLEPLKSPSPPSSLQFVKRHSKRKVSKSPSPLITDLEWSDRDEADADDEELEDFEDEPEQRAAKKPKVEAIPSITPEDPESPKIVKQPLAKQPCILIFDSLAGTNRGKIVATLREYLSIEHEKKKGFKRVFSKETMPGSCPKVPQQMNYSDCGIYTLQYAESFFERPIKDYGFPIRTLEEWFELDVVLRKRDSIAKLLHFLMNNTYPDHSIVLPELNHLSTSTGDVQETQESPHHSPRQCNPTNSPVVSSQETSSNLEICDFKPITEIVPFESKKINFSISNKTLTKGSSSETPSKSTSPLIQTDERQEATQSAAIPSIDVEEEDKKKDFTSEQLYGGLQDIADNYISDADSESDELFFKSDSLKIDKEKDNDKNKWNSSTSSLNTLKTYSKISETVRDPQRDNS